jgi:hypothetical protein
MEQMLQAQSALEQMERSQLSVNWPCQAKQARLFLWMSFCTTWMYVMATLKEPKLCGKFIS